MDSVGRFNPDDIAKIDLLKGVAAEAFTPDAAGRGIVFFTSKRRVSRAATRKLTERVHQLARQYKHAPPLPTPTPQPAGVRYYLNRQPAGRAAVDTIGGRRVRRFQTLRGQQAARFAHDSAATEVFIIETAAAPRP